MPADYKLVVIAASAGGLHALKTVLAALPPDCPAAVVVVQHVDPNHRSLMAQILAKVTALRVKEARDGDRLVPGTVYMAPADRHLLVNADGTLSLSQAASVHWLRPCADLLFESAAATYRERAIGVVLSGTGKDGAMGIQAIKKVGGTVIVQDQGAEFKGMPAAAEATGCADLVLPLAGIAPALSSLLAPPRTIA